MDLENEVVNMNLESEKPTRYCSIAFENRYMSTEERPIFNNKKFYEYKTDRKLEEGQVLKINSSFGRAKVCVVNPDIQPEDITYSGGPDSLVWLDIIEE